MDHRPDALVIHVDALLEREQAREVVRRLDAVPRDAEVVIEFAPTAPCDAVPLSVVAEAIGPLGRRVSVKGLSRQDARILRYLGVAFPFGEDRDPTDSP